MIQSRRASVNNLMHLMVCLFLKFYYISPFNNIILALGESMVDASFQVGTLMHSLDSRKIYHTCFVKSRVEWATVEYSLNFCTRISLSIGDRRVEIRRVA